jgi:hypothetical protein
MHLAFVDYYSKDLQNIQFRMVSSICIIWYDYNDIIATRDIRNLITQNLKVLKDAFRLAVNQGSLEWMNNQDGYGGVIDLNVSSGVLNMPNSAALRGNSSVGSGDAASVKNGMIVHLIVPKQMPVRGA